MRRLANSEVDRKLSTYLLNSAPTFAKIAKNVKINLSVAQKKKTRLEPGSGSSKETQRSEYVGWLKGTAIKLS